MSLTTILIVEDEELTQSVLKNLLVTHGYRVLLAKDGNEMNHCLKQNSVDLVLMDINLPGENGLELGKSILQTPSLGLIFITGRTSDVDKLAGLELGADDYITKPFNPKELLARIKNLLTRLRSKPSDSESSIVKFNNWRLDIHARQLTAPNGNVIPIPRGEFRALNLLIKNAGEIVTRPQLIKAMTGRELKENDRTVDVTIRRLRKHFEQVDGANFIKTIHGEGYRFIVEQ